MGVRELFKDIVCLCPDLTFFLGWNRGTTTTQSIPPCHPWLQIGVGVNPRKAKLAGSVERGPEG